MISRVMYNLKEAKYLHTAKVSGDDWYFKSPKSINFTTTIDFPGLKCNKKYFCHWYLPQRITIKMNLLLFAQSVQILYMP